MKYGVWDFDLPTPYSLLPTPALAYRTKWDTAGACKVWAHAVSLATTPTIVIYFLFLDLLRCFSSVGSRPYFLCVQKQATRHNSSWVFPFGNLRFKACWQLSEAYRSLPRPSSVIYVKASTTVPLSTFLCIDLTSSWKVPNTTPSISYFENFLTSLNC